MNRVILAVIITASLVAALAVAVATNRVQNSSSTPIRLRTTPPGVPMIRPVPREEGGEISQLRKEVRKLQEQMEWLQLKYEGSGRPAVTTEARPESPAEPGAGATLAGQVTALQGEVDGLKAEIRLLSDMAAQNLDALILTLTPEQMLERGNVSMNSGRIDLAQQYFEAYLKRIPNGPGTADVLLNLSVGLLTGGATEKPIEYLEQIRRDFPNNKKAPYVTFYLGMSYAGKGDQDRARQFYEESIPELDSDPYVQALAIFNLADVHLARHDRVQARAQFQRVIDQFTKETAPDIVAEARQRIQDIDSGKE